MPNLTAIQRLWALMGFALLMLATRFHHFGSVNFLPDASLAVFFLAGFYLTRATPHDSQSKFAWYDCDGVYFSALVLLAGLIDYLAINFGGVSDWCVSVAYLFLIPTYAVMYLGGRSSFHFKQLSVNDLSKIAVLLSMAVLLAFFISNASFFWFSDRYVDMDVYSYSLRVLPYLIPYAGYTFIYCGLIFAAQTLWLKTSIADASEQLH